MLRKSLRWSLIYLLEAVAVLLALAIFGIAAVLWRLSSGPVELDFLREDAQRMLARAFEGDVVALGRLQAGFDPQTRALMLMAGDVTVADETGDVIARAPRIEAGLAVDALLLGRLEPVALNIQGGSLSLVRRADGAVGAGLGSAERVAANAQLPERGGDESASLFQLLADPQNPASRLSRLQHVRIEQAAVRIVDGQSGIAWLVDDAGVRFERDDTRILAEIEGQFATPSGFAPVELRLQAGADLETLLFEARFQQLSPAGVLPDSGPLAPLRAVDAPVYLDFVVDATRQGGIRTASIVLDVGDGEILTGGEARRIAGAHLSARFDPVESTMSIHEGWIESDVFSARLEGEVTEIGGYNGALPTRGRFDIRVGEGFVALGDVFERDPSWEALIAQGEIRLDEYAATLDRLELAVDTIRAELAGEVSLSRAGDGRFLPNLRLTGPIVGDVQPATVLAYWPVELADSARSWVQERILGGRFYNARFDLDLRAEDIEAEQMDNERMTLGFDFENASVLYISTMTPLVEGRGHAVLRGNAFEVAMQSGRIGDIELVDGFVDIPRLNPKGAVARYGGVARGDASDILALIDEPPLHLPSEYGLDPALVGGQGEMRFEIRRAMLTDVPVEEIPFFIDGTFSNVSLNVPGTPIELTGGEIAISARQEGLEASGDALFGETPVHIDWTETFGLPDDAASTRIGLSADVTAATLDVFNIPVRRYFDGPIRLTGEAVSDGLDFRSIDLHADLEQALLETPGGVWSKAAGVPGEAELRISVDETGRYSVDALAVRSEGMEVTGSLVMGAESRLERVDLDRLFIEGLADISARLAVPETAGAPLDLQLSGQYVDVSDFVAQLTSLGEGGGVMPVSVNADIARLILSERSVLDEFNLIWRSEAAGIRAFSVSGQTMDGSFQAAFGASEPGGAREFRLQAPSVERVASLFGVESYALGGRMAMLGSAPPLGTEGPLSARLEVTDLTLVRVPILARILAAGSFQGLAALLNGEGIVFDRIDADLLYEDGLMTIGDARAAGNALGVTAAGTIDFASERAAIDGNLAPSYALNSLFGGVPVIGDILVSRPGEGVIGITYSVEGPFDSLTVFANPLSALAPGVLRRIFEGTAAERAARDRAREAGVEELAPEPEDAPEESGPDE